LQLRKLTNFEECEQSTTTSTLKKFEKKINKIKNKNKNAIRKINLFNQTNLEKKGKTNERKTYK